ncbi:MAG: hypothetical protein AVO35_12960 [Candidatus Aegiribacteria sp. MLS_C]|nr:MAG: hypothetical protein AVO35_12960 [Candidatus Aegiribacteria sp. MLS_C]
MDWNNPIQALTLLFMALLYAYFRQKGKLLATKEDIEEITEKVETIKTVYQKSLSEYNIKLENFKKVIEIRICAADQLAEIRKSVWDLYAFNKGDVSNIEDKIRHFTSYMNAYIPFFDNCRSELTEYSEEFKKIEHKSPLSGEDLNPTYRAMEILLAKMLSY